MKVALLLLCLGAAPVWANEPGCPKNMAEWKEWRDSSARALFRERFTWEALSSLDRRFAACAAPLAAEPAAAACVANLHRLTRAITRANDDAWSMALTIPDREYFQRLPFPAMLDFPAELVEPSFLRQLDQDADPDFLEPALKKIDAHNAAEPDPALRWTAFIYRSQHLPTADRTGALGRLFVYVPGREYDRFLQFGLRHTKSLPLTNSASIVTVQKRDPKTGKKLARPQAWLNDLWRVRDDDGNVRMSTRLAEQGYLENCALCHKQPVLPIQPDPEVFDAPRFGAAVRKANAAMDAFRNLEAAHVPTPDYGPGLGPDVPRPDDFLKACAGDRVPDPERRNALGKSMRCARCHDGERRAALRFPSGIHPMPSGTRQSLVHNYVTTHRRMPPDATLSDEERAALVDCLVKEYYGEFDGRSGLLKEWVLQSECTP